MGRDQVRTQVLLLHSEQSTLDSLSSGLDDRYTVHCATSGAEALNTLGDTPIHVIVSAKDLPGMSGVEALREAKKRSPDTIGILLASDSDTGVEALVGEKEVFQVVRGEVAPTDLTKVIDNATRQIRLLALAESANDTAANPDEPAEHIVMETSENGSTIISDGTGTIPVLNPSRISSGVAAGARAVDVLVLTKDDEFLATIRESTRGLHQVHYANTLAQAEDAIASNKVGVAVVDAAMVGDKVEKLTQHLGRKAGRLVSIVAGRRDDGEMLMDLINRGKVYRFLLKPVSPGRARLAIEASVKYHLEAPDTAFKTSSAPAAAAGKAAAATKPAATKSAPPSAANPAGKSAKRESEPVEDLSGYGLGSAFDGDDSSFTETMTGIVSNIGKAITRKKDKPAQPAKEGPDSKKSSTSKADAGKPVPKPATRTNTSAPVADPSARLADGGSGDNVDPSILKSPLVIGGGAIAVLAFVAAGFWIFGGTEEPVMSRPSVAERPATSESAPAPVERQAVESEAVVPAAASDELLAEARLARNAGQIFNPAGSNAIELYASAARAEPGNATIAEEMAAVISEALAMAEKAMLEERPDDAEAALDRVAFADPGNGRLPFLYAQLSQMQVRDLLDDARVAIRESRFEDAGNALVAAEALDSPDNPAIMAVRDELVAARSEQQVDEVLARAAERLSQGQLIDPANDNARYYYELVLSSDPENTVALQGLTTLASKLVLQARGQIDAAEYDSAGALLDEAGRLDPESPELTGAVEALATARAAFAAEQQRQREAAAAARREAEQQAEQERLAEQQAEQERLAAEADAGNDSDAASGDDEGDNGPVAISTLTRTKYVAPKYPRMAERRNISGWVDVVFTVKTDGKTADIEVRGFSPDDVFVNSALRAVENWEFEPVVENGESVERQTGVRLMFALE